MGTTEPIRDKEELTHFREYYLNTKPNPRNYALIILGLHTALRISDLLELKCKDVYNFEKTCFQTHIYLIEHKTRKYKAIALEKESRKALRNYLKEVPLQPDDYLFSKTTQHNLPLSRSQAYRIVRKAANSITNSQHISCHSLRKTFGYHAWKQGIQPAILMDIYNHSSYEVTKQYLGITQDERDMIYTKVQL